MKTTSQSLIAICGAFLAAVLPAAAQAPRIVWELTDGVKAPESAYFDQKSGYVFLSQIGEGGGKAKDGDGWITVLKPDGEVVSAQWFAGLHAPKGMRSFGDILWVADIDRIVGINIKNGRTHAIHEVEGAKFLNDVAASPNGVIYVSDMLTGTIYRLWAGQVTKFAEGKHLDNPNGLLVQGTTLHIAGWGQEIQDDFETLIPGKLQSMDLRTRKVTPVTKIETGNLDGLELDGKGGFLVTDWVAGTVNRISAQGAVTPLINLPKGAADIAYLADKKLLIVPQMLENKVTAYDLSKVIP